MLKIIESVPVRRIVLDADAANRERIRHILAEYVEQKIYHSLAEDSDGISSNPEYRMVLLVEDGHADAFLNRIKQYTRHYK